MKSLRSRVAGAGWLIAVMLAPHQLLLGGDAVLSPRNVEAPFPYLVDGTREWPVVETQVPEGARIRTVIRDGDTVLGEEQLRERALNVTITAEHRLRVVAGVNAKSTLKVDLAIDLPQGGHEQQTVEIRPAPPDRQLTYYADFGDDLIRIFMDPATGKFGPVTKSGFNQYFRRLQAHGMRRLIVWLSPFPYIADRNNYDPGHWQRYERQSRAILDDEDLTRALNGRTGFASWHWLRHLLATRLNPDFGRMLGRSAADHGIQLTVSFRPFEAALTKYYEVAAFDTDGTFLWGFLPLASPTVNYSEGIGWRHYRAVLREIGHAESAELATIELPGVKDAARYVGSGGFRIIATAYPPQSDEARVLVRRPDGQFQLRSFATIRDAAEARHARIEGLQIEAFESGLRINRLTLPPTCRYLILSWTGDGDGPDLSALTPVVLRSAAGHRLGRETTYWVQGGPTDPSRVAGITANGEYWAEFQASEASQRAVAGGPDRLTLAGRQLVIDLGADSTVEMIDFNRPQARQNAVREMATVLQQPGFADILINTRSHVDLPVSIGDGDQGVRPVGQYWHERRGPQIHLGLDKAYLPISETSLALVKELAGQVNGVEQITTWQPNEWRDECQTLAGPRWRYARNRGTADGLQLLLKDFEQAFPGRRIRLLIPPSESAVGKIRSGLDELPQPNGGVYGRGFYYQLWPSNNHIPAVGEGAAMVDLRGLSVEPGFLGSGGYLPGMNPFKLYVRECLADLSENRGSNYRGPRSYFFEAQTTLRAADLAAARRARQEMICHLLSQRENIGEVILYEAADWLYFLSLADPDLCGHSFLDRCPTLNDNPK